MSLIIFIQDSHAASLDLSQERGWADVPVGKHFLFVSGNDSKELIQL